MHIFYYRGSKPNFGDDLNADLWPHLLPPEVLAAPDVVLVGIGSILSEEWLGRFGHDGERVIVLGSGTSYDLPPRRIADWTVLAVRGPLTADLVGRPEAAITDGAILLADVPELVGPERPRREVLFMPHHRSIRRTPWREIAEEAGMRYVSPQQTVPEILDAYAGAELVVTEAMHGAIVADTLRIPWVPLTIAPTVDEFKWRDWCQSMDLPYEPVRVPAGDARDGRRYRRMEKVLQQHGVAGHDNLLQATSTEDLLGYFGRRFAPSTKVELLRADRGTRAGRLVSAAATVTDRSSHGAAVEALRAASRQRPFLSTDATFTTRLEQMREAVGGAAAIVLAG